MRTKKRLLSLLAGVVLVGALPGIAAANTTETIAETGGMSLTVPGVPVTVTVSLDEFGNITEVALDNGDFSATETGEHKVTFVRASADGSTVIQVKAKGGELSAKIKTSNLADITGDHVWSGDVFGDGQTTTVTFSVVPAGDGSWIELANIAVTSPFDNNVQGPYTESDDDDDEGEEHESKAKVEFFDNGYTKTLKIEVETETEDDDDHEGAYAKLKIELEGKDRQELVGTEALGAHTWTGLLCDGTTASVDYTVTEAGITVDGVTVADGVGADVSTSDHGFKVRFTDTAGDDGAYVKAELDNEDGRIELKVKSKTTTSCGDDEVDDDHDDHHDDDHKKSDDDDDHDDDHGGQDDDDHDD